ncbi:hypothetical protein G5C65_36475 [Streptomyces sp. SB3404]|uniref:Integral membrane protein n=1 Tax=Streptomyces boncukensis TaxID=2711219 RepID=A0A6G4XA35_9ACTN|nr:hypothetical protein [Streptomyces boncukensis]
MRASAAQRFAARGALPLLPAALCSVALGALALTRDASPSLRHTVAVAGAVTVLMAVPCALRALPLPRARAVALWACLLTGLVLFSGRPPGTHAAFGVSGAVLGLSLGVAPAVWCARWFAVRARRRLAGSASLEEFAAGVRPLLAAAVALFGCVLLGALFAARAVAGDGSLFAVAALGVLLFTALLLTAHGFGTAAATGLAAACALLSAAVFAAPLAVPSAAPVAGGVWTAPAAPALACAVAELGLLAYALRVLAGASAHHRAAAPA